METYSEWGTHRRKPLNKWKVLGVLLVLVTALIAGEALYIRDYQALDGVGYRRDSRELDFRGRNLEQLDRILEFSELERLDVRQTNVTREQVQWLRESLPDCEVLWELELQDQLLPPDIREVTLTDLSPRDPVALRDFYDLEVIHVRGQENLTILDEIREKLPNCTIDYEIRLGDRLWPNTATQLTLDTEALPEFREKTAYLPEVAAVELEGTLLPVQELRDLQAEYPDIVFSWQVPAGGITVLNTAESLDLAQTGIREVAGFLKLLPYLPELKSVSLLGTELTNAQKYELVTACPGLTFQWEITLGGMQLPGDAEELEISDHVFSSTSELEQALPCFTKLKKLVLLNSGLSNEDLDSLNRKFADIRIVWNLEIGRLEMRTDDLYYAPVKYDRAMVSDNILKDLKYCTDLVCIDVGHKSVSNCEWAAYMPNLRYLVIADTGVSDLTPLQGLKNLVFLELFKTPAKDYSPLLGCTGLEDLNLCYCFGDPEPVKQMTWLKRLWWANPNLSEKDLQAALPNTQVECHSGSSTGAGWREGQHYYDMRDLIGMPYLVG